MIISYLRRNKLRFTAKIITNWQEIPTRCTITAVRCIIGKNLLITAAEGATLSPVLKSVIGLLVLQVFMDSVTITTVSHFQVRWVLKTPGQRSHLGKVVLQRLEVQKTGG